MKYDEVIEAIKAGIKYKKLMADAGAGGGGAGAGGGAAGGSGGASAGGSATSSSGDGGSADGGGSDATPSADSTSSETTSRGGYFAGYGGYWGSKGSKKKKKKKAKVGSVKDGIYESFSIRMKDDHQQGVVGYNKPEMAVAKIKRLQSEKGIDPSKLEVLYGARSWSGDEFIDLYPEEVTEDVSKDKLENKLYELESALGMARETTRDIKYVDTHVEIVSKLSGIAEDVGLELDEYQERQVFEAKNKLESEIYQLEEVFEDAIRDLQNKIDELDLED